jgi:Flp pilus assembly protein TadD
MFLSLQHRSANRFARAALAVVAAASAIAAAGCESAPIRALRGARHYTAGTAALERHDDAKAVAELEQAAVLVPHASEIQNHLGLVYWSDGRPQSARVAFAKAIELDCDNDAARANLEALMQQQGDIVMQAKSEDAIRVDDHGE